MLAIVKNDMISIRVKRPSHCKPLKGSKASQTTQSLFFSTEKKITKQQRIFKITNCMFANLS